MNHRWRVESQLSHVNGDEFRIRQLYRKERLVSNKKSMDHGCLTLIREKKNPKRGTITERVFAEKNPERSIESISICFCAVDFFSGNHAR